MDIEHDHWDDNEGPDAWDILDDPMSETLPCSGCGLEIHEDAAMCPHCGEFVTRSSHPFAGRPWWWIVLGLIGIAAVIFLLAGL